MNYPLKAEDLSKSFRGLQALRGVTFAVPAGSVFMLVGPNGAGKTTLIKTLLNVHQPTSGAAEVLGADSRRLGPAQFAQIGYVSESQRLPGWMSVAYFLSYCKAFYPTWSDEDLADLLSTFKLPLESRLNRLSWGMRVKVSLASALAYRPRILFLDEPFSGLDVLVRDQLVETILDRIPRCTVFLASHELAEMETLATHIAYISEGEVKFVEEMNNFSERFREIEITLEHPIDLKQNVPENWLNLEQSALLVRFVDSRFDKADSDAQIQRFFPGARGVASRALALREIMVALAKSNSKIEGPQ